MLWLPAEDTLRKPGSVGIVIPGGSVSILDETNTYLLVSKFSRPEMMEDNWPGCRILDLDDCSHTAQIGWFQHKYAELSPLAQEYVDLLAGYLQS